MTIQIKQILKKKRLTGDDVGKALVYSVISDIAYGEEPLPFTQARFEIMEGSLTKEEDISTYSVYKSIYEGILESYNEGLGKESQYNNGYHILTSPLRDYIDSEYRIATAELVPYVMTQAQYRTILENAQKKVRNLGVSYYDILCDLIFYFIENPSTAPEDIKEALEATKKQPVNNKRVMEAYCKHEGLGYYILPDGTRSDELTGEEWKQKLTEEAPAKTMTPGIPNEVLKGYELFYKGEDYVKELYKKQTGNDLPPEEIKNIEEYLSSNYFFDNPVINRVAPRSETALQIYHIIRDSLGSGAKWFYYSEPPFDLSKYDILKNHGINFYDGTHNPDKKTHFSEFKRDYPALSKALISYIKEAIPQTRELKPTQYKKDIITVGELANLEVGRYQSRCTEENRFLIIQELAETEEDTLENLLKRRRILHNGIVISQDAGSTQLTENGNFRDDFILSFSRNNLDISTSLPDDKTIKLCRDHLIIPTLRYIYGYNSLMKIIGNLFDMKEMEDLAIDTTAIEKEVAYINKQIYLLYYNVFGTDKEKALKRKLIKKTFLPIYDTDIKPTARAINTLTRELTEAKDNHDLLNQKLKDFGTLIDKLYVKGE